MISIFTTLESARAPFFLAFFLFDLHQNMGACGPLALRAALFKNNLAIWGPSAPLVLRTGPFSNLGNGFRASAFYIRGPQARVYLTITRAHAIRGVTT